MNTSPHDLSDDSLVKMIYESQATIETTKISTADVFNRLAKFNDLFSGLAAKPDTAALIYREPITSAITWKPIGDRLVVGRAPKLAPHTEGTLLPIDDQEMSRQHFEIVYGSDGLYTICDRNSTNGLFIDGSKANTALLIGGTEIRAGRTTFFFTGV
jgi:hypothetical protein